MGTGAWRAEVHGVAESWTQLSNGAQRSIRVNTYVKMTESVFPKCKLK